ncbi:hypothetical protein G9A89_019808 [Geosiphon pyriformis]|nr:hypothetical protein G9A89_019808 [Geosiphon pyriformis]
MNLDLSGLSKTTTPMLSAVFFASNFAIKSRLTSLEFHLSELSVLIKSLVEPVSALVVLVTKLLSTPPTIDVLIKESMAELAKQNKGLAAVVIMMQKRIIHLKKKCKWACLEDVSEEDEVIDDNNDDNKDFSVYDNTIMVKTYTSYLLLHVLATDVI